MPFNIFGYMKRRYPEILEDNKDKARELWGQDINVSSSSTLGKYIELISFRESELAEEIENLYNSRSVAKSSGQALVDNLSDWLVEPLHATYASGVLTLHLDKGVVVQVGTLFRRQGTQVLYELKTEVRASDAGEYKGLIECLEVGEVGNARADEVTVIVNDVFGLTSVTNEDAIVNGQNKETDEDMKKRFERSRALSGTRRIEAIESNILQSVVGLKNTRVIENDTMEIVDGIPPKAIHTIYAGGDGEDVARIVFERKSEGIQAFGNVTYIFTDKHGAEHLIGVTPATEKDLHVRVTLEVTNAYDGDDAVKKSVYEHIGGYYEGALHDGLNMGQTLYASRLETAIGCSVGGINDMIAEFSVDGETYERRNMPLEAFETFAIVEVEVIVNG